MQLSFDQNKTALQLLLAILKEYIDAHLETVFGNLKKYVVGTANTINYSSRVSISVLVLWSRKLHVIQDLLRLHRITL